MNFKKKNLGFPFHGSDRPRANGRPLVYWFLAAFVLVDSSLAASAQDSRLPDKRDPFVSLIPQKQLARMAPKAELKPEVRPEGLAGLTVSEVKVVGTARKGDIRFVLLKGASEFSHIVRLGARLRDGYLESIASDRIAFVEEGETLQGKGSRKRVVKQIGTEPSQRRGVQ